MGVNLFLLDRRTVTLAIGGRKHSIGTLRRFFKLTELDPKRAEERDAAARIRPSPVAVLIMEIVEMPLAAAPDALIPAHLVLGWDEGRGSVTDFGWDLLPQLGYAVREPGSGAYTLHEELSGLLHPVTSERAIEAGLVDATGRMIRHGQPRIAACKAVRHYIAGYAEADCVLVNRQETLLLIAISDGVLPPASWLIGKRPMDIERFILS